jgi:hypothetical protein
MGGRRRNNKRQSRDLTAAKREEKASSSSSKGDIVHDDELINVTLVSKKIHEEDSKRPSKYGIKWKIIPTIVVSASQEEGGGSSEKLLQILSQNQTNEKFQRYPHMKVNDVHKFDDIINYNDAEQMIANDGMDWIK